jgi:hypothetical protein
VGPRDLIRCGCKERLEICYEERPTGDPHTDTLKINGVYATVHQWRQVLLPLLGMKMPDAEREEALRQLEARRSKNAGRKRVDNSALPAGSPMTYYCRSCGDISGVLPEAHSEPVPDLCGRCFSLKHRGWLLLE